MHVDSTFPGVKDPSTVVLMLIGSGESSSSSSSSVTLTGVWNESLTEVLPGSASSSVRAIFVIRRSLCGIKLRGFLFGFNSTLLQQDKHNKL